jgi:hypothetical protein
VLGLSIALAIDAGRMQHTWLDASPAFNSHWIGTLGIGAAYGTLPDGSLGTQAGLEFAWLSWFGARFDVFAQYSWSNTISGSSGRFDAVLAAGSLQLCAGGWPDLRLRIALCAGPALGAVHAWGRHYQPDVAATAVWVAARSGIRFDARLGVRWLLDLDVISRIYAPRFFAHAAGGDFTRDADATGFMMSLGPAFVF